MEPHVHRIVELGNNKAKAVGPCRKTRKEYSTTEFNLMGYMSWILKEDKIQNCLPDLNVDDREFLMTGFSPEGWNVIFGDNN
tara:strand:- start:332 stop:577 length:246 start_codon:yes stop_codon:yes gene_type:complete